MAQRKYWVGSTGPFLYDDTGQYADAVTYRGFRTSGTVKVESVPVDDEDVTRLVDMNTSINAAKVASLIISSFRA